MRRSIDLSGQWLARLDEDNLGLSQKWYEDDFANDENELIFTLPGSACDNHIGRRQEWYDSIVPEAIRAPREHYEYIGALWLQRKIDVDEIDCDREDVQLFLERVNVSSQLFIDGARVGREIIELSTPHIYDLTGRLFKLTKGEHLLTLRLDNSDLVNMADMASGYSVDTMGYWIGVIGKITLDIRPRLRIDDIQVHPNETGLQAEVIVRSEQYVPMECKIVTMQLMVTCPDGRELSKFEQEIELFTSRQRIRLDYDLHNFGEESISYWDEFRRDKYTLTVTLLDEGDEKKIFDSCCLSFGMRTVEVRDKRFYINNRRFALRGTTNCAQFPLTGYPAMDYDYWDNYMSVMKSWGLNHIRFHAWCPPGAAFEAADNHGLYLLVEMPLWLNKDVTGLELGDDPIHHDYYMRESMQIRRTFGNHPSFIMFSCGNENMGDYTLLEDCIERLKSQDRRCLYTLSSNFDHPVHPCEDYFSAFEMGHMAARIQFLHDEVAIASDVNYDKIVEKLTLPLVSFEVGQYCVYPDVSCIDKYSGNIMPVNFDVINKEMIKKGVRDRLDDYIKASGDLAAKLYKEDIEAVLRTRDFGGIQLLSISDYTGQSTATIGILDAFLDDKKVISQESFTGFCNEVVPLFEARRIFTNEETIKARLALYDFGEKAISPVSYEVSIFDSDREIYKTTVCGSDGPMAEADFTYDLSEIAKSSLLKVRITVRGNGRSYTNEWRIFVFAKDLCENTCEVSCDESLKKGILQDGISQEGVLTEGALQKRANKKIITMEEAGRRLNRILVKTNFIPVFWSPVFFPSDASTGAIIDKNHPLLANFPTEEYVDYQWKRLLENAYAIDLAGLDARPIIEMVPNFVTNKQFSPLFELRLDGEDYLVCGFDLEDDDITARALKASIIMGIV